VSTSIVGVGAVSPLGFDARQTAFALRARKLAPRPSIFRDRRSERIGTARTLGLPDELIGVARMVEIGGRALREAARDAGMTSDQPLRVFVTVAENSRPLPESEQHDLGATSFLPKLEKSSKQRIDGAGSEVLRLGHAGFAAALERAIAALGSGSPIAVGGIDSYHHPEIMKWLDKELRVLTHATHNGFVPAEGAGFIVIAPAKHPKTPIAKVTHATAGVEQLEPDEPRIGTLMTDMVRLGAEAMRVHHVPWVITDMNGERHREKEWTFVSIRNRDRIHSGEARLDHLGQLMGDAGAASGGLAATYATQAFRTGFAVADEALLALHSDGDERGVVVLEAAS